MRALCTLLFIKILVTLVAACMPLLFFPLGLLQRLGFAVPESAVFLRLLGMAYLALLVSYGFALRDARCGIYPAAGVWVGIVSNAGAYFILTITWLQGGWAGWGQFAQISMLCAWLGTAAISAGLLLLGPCRAKLL